MPLQTSWMRKTFCHLKFLSKCFFKCGFSKYCFHGFSFLDFTFNLEGVVLGFWFFAWAHHFKKNKKNLANYKELLTTLRLTKMRRKQNPAMQIAYWNIKYRTIYLTFVCHWCSRQSHKQLFIHANANKGHCSSQGLYVTCMRILLLGDIVQLHVPLSHKL